MMARKNETENHISPDDVRGQKKAIGTLYLIASPCSILPAMPYVRFFYDLWKEERLLHFTLLTLGIPVLSAVPIIVFFVMCIYQAVLSLLYLFSFDLKKIRRWTYPTLVFFPFGCLVGGYAVWWFHRSPIRTKLTPV